MIDDILPDDAEELPQYNSKAESIAFETDFMICEFRRRVLIEGSIGVEIFKRGGILLEFLRIFEVENLSDFLLLN